MPIGQVSKGTKENFRVQIVDIDGAVTDLSTSVPKFDVIDQSDAFKYGTGTYAGGQAATASGMVITCLVDTNQGGTWAEGPYRLFVWFVIGTQTIRKGPYFFSVIE